MAQREQSLLVFHGAVVLLIGSLFGFPIVAATESGSESLQAWTSAHSAVVATIGNPGRNVPCRACDSIE